VFNVGGGELLIILFVALVVLGPDKLPDAARKLGNVMGEIKRMSAGFQDELKQAMDTPNKAVTSVRDTVKGTASTSSTPDAEERAAEAAETTGPVVAPEPITRADDDIRPIDPTGARGPVERDTARTDDPAA